MTFKSLESRNDTKKTERTAARKGIREPPPVHFYSSSAHHSAVLTIVCVFDRLSRRSVCYVLVRYCIKRSEAELTKSLPMDVASGYILPAVGLILIKKFERVYPEQWHEMREQLVVLLIMPRFATRTPCCC